ncbi:hypothetical protein [uncultured Serinicoccus sp.]|uniref:hypothetical protein n=1 Tax=uncultured Serinicoccus sp. TaxID=735514 RepID=UPI002638EA31|nr:hypothetical protein [uncultured Serinicoccus sp.]
MGGVENAVHGGRGLRAWGGQNAREDVAGWPQVACESIRAINHLTSQGYAVPAPVLYEVVGNLKGVGYLLPQALTQLGEGLEKSLAEYDVYDTAGDPHESVDVARGHLLTAADAARTLGAALEAAQSAIAGQGYRTQEERR